MKIAFFSTKTYEKNIFTHENEEHGHVITFFACPLNENTVSLAKEYESICCFVEDHLDSTILKKLDGYKIRLIALRSSGYNHVDIKTAQQLDLSVCRVPDYSPYSIAEHAAALILTLNRKIHRAYNRIKEFNFSLEGLEGFDLFQKTVGVIGTGRIGYRFACIMKGFGCHLLGYDLFQNIECKALGMQYTTLDEIYRRCQIISLHCPLTNQTYHLIDKPAIRKMQKGMMLINTSRGALINTSSIIDALREEKIGYLGLDVYEEEESLFFKDLSSKIIKDEEFVRLHSFPNVLITSHQGFFTKEALHNIATITLKNITEFEKGSAMNLISTL